MIKQIFLAAIPLLITSVSANAQFEKGTHQAGVKFTPSLSTSTFKGKYIGLGFTPSYDYFILKNLSIGFRGSYYYGQTLGVSYLTTKSSSYSLGLEGRYYLANGKLKPFAYVGGSLETNRAKMMFRNFETINASSKNVSLSYGLGLAYFFNSRLSIETTFGSQLVYNVPSKNQPDYNLKNRLMKESTTLLYGMQSSIGVKYNLLNAVPSKKTNQLKKIEKFETQPK